MEHVYGGIFLWIKFTDSTVLALEHGKVRLVGRLYGYSRTKKHESMFELWSDRTIETKQGKLLNSIKLDAGSTHGLGLWFHCPAPNLQGRRNMLR